MEPTIAMLRTVLVCMLLIPTMRFVRLNLVLVGLVRRRRISVGVRLVLIRLGVLRSRLVALEMLLLRMGLTLVRVQLCVDQSDGLLRDDAWTCFLPSLIRLFFLSL
jgi:hypothetical protein